MGTLTQILDKQTAQYARLGIPAHLRQLQDVQADIIKALLDLGFAWNALLDIIALTLTLRFNALMELIMM